MKPALHAPAVRELKAERVPAAMQRLLRKLAGYREALAVIASGAPDAKALAALALDIHEDGQRRAKASGG